MSIPTRYFTFDSLQKALKEALQEAKLMESTKVYLTQEQVWAIGLILNRAKILDPKRADAALGERMFEFPGETTEQQKKVQPDRTPASTKYQGETR